MEEITVPPRIFVYNLLEKGGTLISLNQVMYHLSVAVSTLAFLRFGLKIAEILLGFLFRLFFFLICELRFESCKTSFMSGKSFALSKTIWSY